jgi:hypothetical protein
LTDDAVSLIPSVDVGAGDQAVVVDASQLGVAGTRDVHRAESTVGKEEAVGVASGIVVRTRNVPDVVDAEGDRAGGEGKVMGVKTPPRSTKPWEVMLSDHAPTISPAALILAGAVPVDPGKSMDVKTPPLRTKPCSTNAASKWVPTICPASLTPMAWVAALFCGPTNSKFLRIARNCLRGPTES